MPLLQLHQGVMNVLTHHGETDAVHGHISAKKQDIFTSDNP